MNLKNTLKLFCGFKRKLLDIYMTYNRILDYIVSCYEICTYSPFFIHGTIFEMFLKIFHIKFNSFSMVFAYIIKIY